MKNFVFSIAMGLAATSAGADGFNTNLNLSGVPGIIDMPSGLAAPDGNLDTTFSHFSGISRIGLSFQITERLGGTFRYSATENWPNSGVNTYYDRNFDLRYLLIEETDYLPAVTVGLQDFAGTGLNSAEYIAATKHLTDNFRITAGLGFGRLASYNGFDNPFGLDDRPDEFSGNGGQLNADRFFRGPAAIFGGVEWQVSDRLRLMAEYSTDGYLEEVSRGIVDRKSPFNMGFTYSFDRGVDVSGYAMYGTEIGARVSIMFNPQNPPAGAGSEAAGAPVQVRPQGVAAALTWPEASGPSEAELAAYTQATAQVYASQGLELERMAINGHTVTVHFRNNAYDIETQALGRAARFLTYTMPPGVEIFRLVPVVDGLPASAVTIRRSDLEANEHAADGGMAWLSGLNVQDAYGIGQEGFRNPDLYPEFTWSISPYLAAQAFGIDNPLRADVGLQASGTWDVAPGFSFSAQVRQPILGNLGDDEDGVNSSLLPHVRTDADLYSLHGDPAISRLTADYLFRPGPDLYGRISAGYLESMFGGVSTELLWKPVDSRFALGVEVNAVRKRDYDQLFGFQDYSVVTGHVSGYYDFENGFHLRVDAGRYLAGDWGATFTLQREFANGWKVGAFATLTDASPEEFGEGSFDKGIMLTIPLSSYTGQPTRTANSITIRPVLRDGGARLAVGNRLYGLVRDYHEPEIALTWGRFLR